MKKKLSNDSINGLFEAILKLKNLDECRDFFEDLCTVSELMSMSQRLEVAKMLNKDAIYTDISAATGASTATISRVNRSLNYGSDGYKLILERITEDE